MWCAVFNPKNSLDTGSLAKLIGIAPLAWLASGGGLGRRPKEEAKIRSSSQPVPPKSAQSNSHALKAGARVQPVRNAAKVAIAKNII